MEYLPQLVASPAFWFCIVIVILALEAFISTGAGLVVGVLGGIYVLIINLNPDYRPETLSSAATVVAFWCIISLPLGLGIRQLQKKAQKVPDPNEYSPDQGVEEGNSKNPGLHPDPTGDLFKSKNTYLKGKDNE